MKLKKQRIIPAEIHTSPMSDSEIKELVARFIKEYFKLECRCFMCRDIIKKIEQSQMLSEGDRYHMSVCLPSLKRLREKNEMSIKEKTI